MWNPFGTKQSNAVQMAAVSAQRLAKIRKSLRKDLKDLRRVEKKTNTLLERLGLIAETTAEDIEDCERRIAYSEKATEALRSELEIVARIENPRLITALKRFQASDEAEIAMSNHRRAAATPTNIE